jgi:hypothetical protein
MGMMDDGHADMGMGMGMCGDADADPGWDLLVWLNLAEFRIRDCSELMNLEPVFGSRARMLDTYTRTVGLTLPKGVATPSC